MRRLISALRGWWNRHALAHPLVAGALVLTLQPLVPMGPVNFAGLGAGEMVEVRYHSTGCYYSERGRITVTRTGGGFRYTAAVSDGEFRGRRSGRLPHTGAAWLEMAMQAYRSLPRGPYCTNTEHVVVTRYFLGWPVARESFEIHTCARVKRGSGFWDLLPPRD